MLSKKKNVINFHKSFSLSIRIFFKFSVPSKTLSHQQGIVIVTIIVCAAGLFCTVLLKPESHILIISQAKTFSF